MNCFIVCMQIWQLFENVVEFQQQQKVPQLKKIASIFVNAKINMIFGVNFIALKFRIKCKTIKLIFVQLNAPILLHSISAN